MKRSLLVIAASTALAAGIGSGAASGSPQAARQATERPAATAAGIGARVKVRSTRYGKILVDGQGRTLYLFTRDARRSSRCYDDCARAWPPLTTGGTPHAGVGAHERLVGSVARNSGRRQVTYRGHPLYYYVDDRSPGQVLCQNVYEFGGTWLVVSRSGTAVR